MMGRWQLGEWGWGWAKRVVLASSESEPSSVEHSEHFQLVLDIHCVIKVTDWNLRSDFASEVVCAIPPLVPTFSHLSPSLKPLWLYHGEVAYRGIFLLLLSWSWPNLLYRPFSWVVTRTLAVRQSGGFPSLTMRRRWCWWMTGRSAVRSAGARRTRCRWRRRCCRSLRSKQSNATKSIRPYSWCGEVMGPIMPRIRKIRVRDDVKFGVSKKPLGKWSIHFSKQPICSLPATSPQLITKITQPSWRRRVFFWTDVGTRVESLLVGTCDWLK